MVQRLGAGPFYGGASPNLADLTAYAMLSSLLAGEFDHVPASAVDPFPSLIALEKALKEHPLVKEHGVIKK